MYYIARVELKGTSGTLDKKRAYAELHQSMAGIDFLRFIKDRQTNTVFELPPATYAASSIIDLSTLHEAVFSVVHQVWSGEKEIVLAVCSAIVTSGLSRAPLAQAILTLDGIAIAD